MIKQIIPALLATVLLTSCMTLKPLSSSVTSRTINNTTSSATTAVTAPTTAAVPKTTEKQVKFLDDISISAASSQAKEETAKATANDAVPRVSVVRPEGSDVFHSNYSSSGKASALQIKYAALLNTTPELLVENNSTLNLLEHVDEWYGTRYRMGGTTKSGIDCSAFVQTIYLSAFGVAIPRTAAEQFRVAKIISATELKEGDLVFFNTTGGVSHVGLYLANNKFVHASSSEGVKVSDLFENYYLRRYLGAGRIEKSQAKN
ncbi:MAG: C40 family peptidase [Chitinophagaceae bacterium]